VIKNVAMFTVLVNWINIYYSKYPEGVCCIIECRDVYSARELDRCILIQGGFGGLGVASWPLVPKFAAEAVGFLRGEKNPQHAFLRRGSKAVGPMS